MFTQKASIILAPNSEIMQLQMAYDHTYLLLYKSEQKRIKLSHFKANGILINSYPVGWAVNKMVMVSEFEVIVPDTNKRCIEIIDLKRRLTMKYKYDFLENHQTLQLFFFSQTKLLAIKETTPTVLKHFQLQKSKIKLTYFKYPFVQIASYMQPYEIYEFDNKKVELRERCYLTAEKGNNHSMLIFKKTQQYDNNTLMLVDVLIQEKCKKVRTRVISILMPKQYTFYKVFIWQINQHELLVIPACLNMDYTIKVVDMRDKSQKKYKLKLQKVNSYCQALFLEGYIWLREQHNNIYGTRVKQEPCSTFFINYHQQQITMKIKQQSATVQKTDYICQYDPEVILETIQDQESSTLLINKLRPVNMKGLYMHMLLHLNQDLDDDLLLDSMKLLIDSL